MNLTPYQPHAAMQARPATAAAWAALPPERQTPAWEQALYATELALMINGLPGCPPQIKQVMLGPLTVIIELLQLEPDAIEFWKHVLLTMNKEARREAELDTLRNLVLPPGVKRKPQ